MRTDPAPTRVCSWLITLLLALPLPAAALDWYTVEVLVFAEQSAAGLDEEAWSSQPGLPDLAAAVVPGEGDFEALSRSELELAGVARQLDRSGRYRTLLMTGWRQPGFGPRRAVPVRVQTDDGSSGGGLLGAGSSLFGGGTPERRPTIEGTVRVHRSRFLHVLVDLVYSREPPAAEADLGTPTLFRMTQTRRMRSRELHYYDHPLFGVLVKVTPYGAQEEPEPTEDPADAAAEPDAAEPAPEAPAD